MSPLQTKKMSQKIPFLVKAKDQETYIVKVAHLFGGPQHTISRIIIARNWASLLHSLNSVGPPSFGYGISFPPFDCEDQNTDTI